MSINKNIKKALAVAFLVVGLYSLQSCVGITTIKLLTSENPRIYKLSNGDREIVFIGMVHVGKKVFYEKVKQKVIDYKKQGYPLFYEYLREDKTLDKDAYNTVRLKLRKLLGFIPSEEAYQKVVDNFGSDEYRVQHNPMFLGLVNDKDYNTDMTDSQLIKIYEDTYGEIELTDVDRNTPIDDKVPSLPKKKVFDIILNKRNEYVIKELEKSNEKKVLLMYGFLHKKGIVKLLKSKDYSWEEERLK